jgi:hypothetical protein
MCLITEQNKAIILEEDLIVYKLIKKIGDCYYSTFFDFDWTKNVLEEVVMKSHQTDYDGGDDVPFDTTAKQAYEEFFRNELTVWKEGFHFAFQKSRLFCYGDNEEVMPFKIPKGANIVEDLSGLGVTNKIMML